MKQRKYMFFVDVTHLPTGEVTQHTLEGLVRMERESELQEVYFRNATVRACDRARNAAQRIREGNPSREQVPDYGLPSPRDYSARVFSVVDIS